MTAQVLFYVVFEFVLFHKHLLEYEEIVLFCEKSSWSI